MLRRAEMDRQLAAAGPLEDTIVAGDLTLSLSKHRATLRGVELTLRPKEFDLLAHLMRHPGLALSRDQLMNAVWGYEYPGDARTVDVHVRWLREKIEDIASRPRRIETVRNIGYRFNG
jgi:DNA-binding response OmpR family regulator